MAETRDRRRVTIVIPTFDRCAFLREALASALAQTYGDVRVVVLDNASTDGTAEFVGAVDDPRLEYVRRTENVGLLGNFRDALTRIDGDYGLILCDDDRLHPAFLEETVPVLERDASVGVVHTAFDVIDAGGSVVEAGTDWTYGPRRETVETGARFLEESMRWGCRVCSSAALMRTSAIHATGFEEADMPALDFGLWLRMALAWDFAFVPRPLAAYRIHGRAETARFGRPDGAGYDGGLEWVDTRLRVKERFLDAYGGDLADAARLRRLARRARSHELVWLVRKATLPERDRTRTARALAWAARHDPRVLTAPEAWLTAAGSLIGPQGVTRLKGLARR